MIWPRRPFLPCLILLLGLTLPQTARAGDTDVAIDLYAVFSDGTPFNGIYKTILCGKAKEEDVSCAAGKTFDGEYTAGLGHFSLPMGDLVGIMPATFYLQVTIETSLSVEELPALELHAVPWAINAKYAGNIVDGGTLGSVVIRGFGEVVDSTGEWVGPQIAGAKGEQGPAGPTGLTGPQGATGAQGTPTTVNTGAGLTGGGSGTVINLEVVDGGITSAKIADGTITTADIHAAAQITDGQVNNNLTISAGTVDDSVIGGTTPAAGTFTTLLAKTSLAFEDPTAGVKKVTIDAPDNLAGDYALQLPPNVGAANQVLQTDGLLGALVWATVDTSATNEAPTGATYITQTADNTLTAEQALSTLATGYMKVTTGTGVVSSQATPIPVGDGGIGATTLTAGGVLFGNAAGAIQASGVMAEGQLLIGDGTGQPSIALMSSDASIASTGALTIAANAVALTTDTTGNYVAGITPGTEITVSGAAGEGWSPTVGVTANGLDFSEFEDALDLDAALTVTQGANTWTQNFSGTTGPGITFGVLNSATTAVPVSGININLSNSQSALASPLYTGLFVGLTYDPSVAGNTNESIARLQLVQNDTTVSDLTLANGLYIQNADTSLNGQQTIDNGILIDSVDPTGAITDGIDVSDAEIVNAVNIGANAIDGTNFDVTAISGTPTVDMVSITNAGQAVNSNNNVDALGVTFEGGANSISAVMNGLNISSTFTLGTGGSHSTQTMRGAYVKLTDNSGDSAGTAEGMRVEMGDGTTNADNILALSNTDPAATTTSGIRIESSGGTITNGINIATTAVTTDISLQNSETIDNNTDGVVKVTGGSAAPSGLIVVPPAIETIASLGTITANACGTVKRITAAAPIATNATHTFTAPSATYDGCCMDVINVGTNSIRMDDNSFKTDIAGGPSSVQWDAIRVCCTSDAGGTFFWYMAGHLVDNL